MDRQILLRVPQEIYHEIQRVAESHERSVAWLARKIIEATLKSPSFPDGFPPQPIYNNTIPPPSFTLSSSNYISGEIVPKASKQKRGQRIPTDFLPDEAGQELAISLGLDLQATLDNFRDFWTAKPGQGGMKLDWQATWRNWCRNTRGRGAVSARATGLEGNYND